MNSTAPPLTYIDLHLVVESIVHNETVTHADTMRLHRMSRSIMIVSTVLVVKVGNTFLGLGCLLSWHLKCLCARSCRRLFFVATKNNKDKYELMCDP